MRKNGLGEIELDWDHKTSFYKLYKDEMERKGDPTIGKSKVLKLWNSVFPHVRIKKYKSFGGKNNSTPFTIIVRCSYFNSVRKVPLVR